MFDTFDALFLCPMHCLWTRTRCAARSRLAATCRVRSPPWWKRVLSARLRVQDAIEKETTLNILMQQRQQSDTSSERIDAIAAQRQLPACLVPQYLTDLYTLAVTDTSPHLPFTIRLKQLCDRVRPPRVIHDQPQSPPPPHACAVAATRRHPGGTGAMPGAFSGVFNLQMAMHVCNACSSRACRRMRCWSVRAMRPSTAG